MNLMKNHPMMIYWNTEINISWCGEFNLMEVILATKGNGVENSNIGENVEIMNMLHQ